MYKRIMHDEKGNLSDQAYGNKGQAIYSRALQIWQMIIMDLGQNNVSSNDIF